MMWFNEENVKNVKANNMYFGIYINGSMVKFINSHMKEKLVLKHYTSTAYRIQHPDIYPQYIWPQEFFTDKGVDVI